MSGGIDNSPVEQRLVEVETRLAFQERMLLELSDALASERQETARMATLLSRMLEEQQRPRDGFADAADEPPPPHY